MQSQDDSLMAGNDNFLDQKMFTSIADFNAAATSAVDGRRKVMSDNLLECGPEGYPCGKRLAPVGANECSML